MIRINLLPLELRRKEGVHKIPLPAIIYVVILAIVGLHILLTVLMLYKKIQLGSLNHKWNRMQPQFEEVSALKKDLVIKRDKVRVIEYISKRDIYVTDFLNKINQAVPRGLWLNRLSFSSTGFVIEGSVFSFGTEEIALVNNFFNGLKNNSFFVQNFDNFNLDSVQRRNIRDYEVLDFLLTAEIKKEKS